jgi:hypothetical protein
LNQTSLRTLARLAMALSALLGAATAQAIEYAQLDTASNATSAVLVHALGASTAERPAPLLSANYARWSGGEAAAAAAVYRWSIGGDTHHWTVGAGLGVNDLHDRDGPDAGHDTRSSARLQSEWDGPVPGGRYYALAQASTFRGSWLAVAQYAPAGWPVALEASRYHERGYQATNLGASFALGSTRWFLRAGNTHAEGVSRPYIGIAYNGF